MKKIKEKIRSSIIGIVIIGLYITMFSFYAQNLEKNTELETFASLSEIAMQGAVITKTHIEATENVLMAMSSFISSSELMPTENYFDFLRKEAYRNNYKRCGIILADGTAHTTDNQTFDFSSRDYFKKAIKGQINTSDVIVDKADGKKIIVCAVPIYENNKPVAVLFSTSSVEILKNKLAVSTFGGNGYSYIVKSNGTPMLFSNNPNSLPSFDNAISLFKTMYSSGSSKNDDIALNLERGMGGTLRASIENQDKFISYEPIGINEWFIFSIVPSDAVNKNTNRNIIFTLLFGLVTVLIFFIFLVFLSIANRHKKNELSHLAFVDPLTGFSNWNGFKREISEMLLDGSADEYALVVMDIDEFKVINDLFGYKYGNKVLRLIANTISSKLDEGECLSHGSADIFHIMLKFSTQEMLTLRINDIIDSIVRKETNTIIKLSAGAYVIDDVKLDPNLINDRASMAKMSVKGRMSVKLAYYNGDVREKMLLENEIENEMEAALASRQFKVYLQPKYSFSTGEIVGAEALVRWLHPQKGIIAPYKFIPLFEKNGFITKLDRYMISQVCHLLSKWSTVLPDDDKFTVSVNLSRIHLNNPNLVRDLTDMAQDRNIHPSKIEIELTESAIFNDTKALINIMGKLKEAGFSISIDDFGSGYSSLNLLKDLPADVLKIDKEFLSEATDTGKGKKIIKSIVSMAKDIGLVTVAEGVETAEQADFLTEIGCDIAQGYFYAKPMQVEDFEKLAFPSI